MSGGRGTPAWLGRIYSTVPFRFLGVFILWTAPGHAPQVLTAADVLLLALSAWRLGEAAAPGLRSPASGQKALKIEHDRPKPAIGVHVEFQAPKHTQTPKN